MVARLSPILAVAVCFIACRFDEGGVGAGSDGAVPRADAQRPDASSGDAGIDATIVPGIGDHLLISEIKAHSVNDEFIEIYNPTGSVVDLTNYYLSDHADYALLAGEFGGPPPQIGLPFDFVVQFPPNATIEPRGVVVVAVKGTDFTASYGMPADYAMTAGDSAELMLPTILGSEPSLTDTGEMVALFRWNGQSDLVTDVDLAIAGNAPASYNDLATKTGVFVDGPDGDLAGSQYLDEAMTIGDIDADAGSDLSYKRIALEGSFELDSDGNGVMGHDETSESIATTWDDGATFTAPTPGTVPNSINP